MKFTKIKRITAAFLASAVIITGAGPYVSSQTFSGNIDAYAAEAETSSDNSTEAATDISRTDVSTGSSVYVQPAEAVEENDETAYWRKFSSDYYYNQMSDGAKALYDAFDAECMNFLTGDADAEKVGRKTWVLDGIEYSGLSSDEIYAVELLFEYANPQYYFVSGEITSDQKGDSAVGGDTVSKVYLVVYSSYADGTLRKAFTANIRENIEAYLSVAQSADTDYAKERIIHDEMLNSLYYVENSKDQTIASPLLKRLTVCAGYSKLFELLMNGLGVETIAVTSEDHAWNEICLDGSWYIVDVTWDDNLNDGGSEDVSYTYFNISDKTLRKNDEKEKSIYSGKHYVHTPEYSYEVLNVKIPECSKDYESSDTTDASYNDEVYLSSVNVKRIRSGVIRVRLQASGRHTGYKITYRLKKAGSKEKTIVIRNSSKKITRVIKGLKAGQKYQIKAVAYLKSKGVTYTYTWDFWQTVKA